MAKDLTVAEIKQIKERVFQEILTEAQMKNTHEEVEETKSEEFRRKQREYFANYEKNHRKELSVYLNSIPDKKTTRPSDDRRKCLF